MSITNISNKSKRKNVFGMSVFLLIAMFLLIYSPKIAGNIDTLSAFSIIIFIIALLGNKTRALYKVIYKPIRLYIVFGVLMVIYSYLLFAFNSLTDTYQILRFGRTIVNTLGILGLASLYFNTFKERFSEYFLLHLWICIILHGLLMLLMFLDASFNAFVINDLLLNDPMSRGYEMKISGLRIGGLTSSWDATSGVQSLGIILLPFVYNVFCNNFIKKLLALITIPLSFFAIAISGVTGVVVLGIVAAIFVVIHYKRINFKIVFHVGFAALITLFLLNWVLKDNEQRIQDSSIGRTLYMITENDEAFKSTKAGNTAKSTFDRIFNEMYFMPDKLSAIIFGKGGSGRSKDYLIIADPGPTLNLHNLGIIFVVMLYTYYIRMIFHSIKLSKKNFYIGLAIASILLSLLIIDSKVQYLLARQSFSIMMIALIILHFKPSQLSRKKQIN